LPFVKVILDKLVVETDVLAMKGIGVVAINPNDYISFPDDSFDNMQKISKNHGFGFPYLLDENRKLLKNMDLYVHQIFLDIILILNYNTVVGLMTEGWNLQIIQIKATFLKLCF
jgi:hypothetical protein